MPVEQLIYTDLPRGQGVDPNCGGYQIKACSPTLSDEDRSRLDAICRHYGAAVYLLAPRAARDAEQQWRMETASLDNVPETVLSGFPVIWTYDRLADDRFALTRVSYCGLTHDSRPGNFLAHALIFNPEDLSEFNFNPLTLARSEVFHNDDFSAFMSLTGLTNHSTESLDGEILRSGPYQQHLPDLLRSLCHAMPDQRPLLLGLADWREGNTLVESLLDLLPYSVRSRTTFTTYESDRQWTPQSMSGPRTGNQTAAHHLLILSSYDTKPFDLRADEYQRTFAVFNFVEQKFSEWTTPQGPYVKFALDSSNQRALEELRTHHLLVATLGVGHDVCAWDTLVSARHLGASFRVETLPSICAAFSNVAQQPAQAYEALELLRPHIARLATASDFQTLEALVEDVSKLAKRADQHSERTNLQSWLATLSDRIREAFDHGNGRAATALLQMCGAARTECLLAVLNGVLSADSIHSHRDSADQKAIVTLLVEGLIKAGERSRNQPPLNQWLVSAFKLSSEMNLLRELWTGIGDRVVKPHLNGGWNADKDQVTQDLLVHATPARCGEANVSLNLRLIDAKPPQGQALMDQLVQLAQACGQSPNGRSLAEEVMKRGLAYLPAKHEEIAETLAQLAEGVLHTEAGETFFQAYLKESDRLSPNQFQLRRKLASAGKCNVVSLEFVEELTPWNPDRFQLWWDEILRADKQLLDRARKAAATRLRTASRSANASLAKALLPETVESTLDKPGLSDLYDAVATQLILASISARWSQIMDQIPDGEGRSRLRLMSFMRDVEQLAGNSGWSIQQFEYDHPAWKSDVKLLSHDDNEKLITWCLSQFESVGVNDFKEAERLVKILAALGVAKPAEIVDRVMKFIEKRDVVTRVNIAMAFARCYLELSEDQRLYGSVALSILQSSDKQMRNLFEAHLKGRFAPDSSEFQKKLDELCHLLGFAAPKQDKSSSKTKSEAGEDEFTDSSESSGVLGVAKRSWHRLLGGSKDK